MEKTVVIVGAGFAGLSAAKKLANKENIKVVLIDQKNFHLFQPLLYQVATAGLNPADIASPIRAEFDDAANVSVHMGRVDSIDTQNKVLHSKDALSLKYDYLIVACGAKHSYFGKPEWEEFAPGLKTIEQATEIRRRILMAFENAENELDPAKRDAFLTFVVVGAGPTGVEMAGAISDISQTVLVDDFKFINTKEVKIVLIEAGPKVLGAFHETLSQRTQKDLQAMGVSVRTGARVTNINRDGVEVDGAEFISAKTVIWAAGVQASKIKFTPEVEKDRAGRVVVQSDFSLSYAKDTFVVGDMAAFRLADGSYLPGLAPAAKQAGEHAAACIQRSVKGQERKDFKYTDKGIMATIGKRRAVAQVGNLRISGLIAWLGWLLIHVLYLIGFKNKVAVISQWVWSYLFQRRSSRLITDKNWKLEE